MRLFLNYRAGISLGLPKVHKAIALTIHIKKNQYNRHLWELHVRIAKPFMVMMIVMVVEFFAPWW